MEGEPVLRVTTAPEAYDGFGTETVKLMGTVSRVDGKPYRLVSIPLDALDWQTGRYMSGLYPCISGEEYTEWEELGIL